MSELRTPVERGHSRDLGAQPPNVEFHGLDQRDGGRVAGDRAAVALRPGQSPRLWTAWKRGLAGRHLRGLEPPQLVLPAREPQPTSKIQWFKGELLLRDGTRLSGGIKLDGGRVVVQTTEGSRNIPFGQIRSVRAEPLVGLPSVSAQHTANLWFRSGVRLSFDDLVSHHDGIAIAAKTFSEPVPLPVRQLRAIRFVEGDARFDEQFVQRLENPLRKLDTLYCLNQEGRRVEPSGRR